MVQGNQPDFSPVKVECFKFSMFEERPEQDVEKVRSVPVVQYVYGITTVTWTPGNSEINSVQHAYSAHYIITWNL